MQFPNIAESTAKSRIRFLNKLGIKSFDDWKHLSNVGLVLTELSIRPTSRKTEMFHIIYYLKQIPEANELLSKYEEANIPIITAAQEVVENNTYQTDPRAERYLKLEDLRKRLDELPDSLDKILVSLYVNNPPIRNNYYNAKIVKRRADIDVARNNIVITSRSIRVIVHKHKTRSQFGPIDFELDKKTSDMIRRLGFPIHSEDQFRKRLKNLSNKFFGYPIGIDDYRHIWEINLQKSDAYKNMTVLQQKKEHEKLYHSMQTALLYNRI